jgi:hypothetical protein
MEIKKIMNYKNFIHKIPIEDYQIDNQKTY